MNALVGNWRNNLHSQSIHFHIVGTFFKRFSSYAYLSRYVETSIYIGESGAFTCNRVFLQHHICSCPNVKYLKTSFELKHSVAELTETEEITDGKHLLIVDKVEVVRNSSLFL